MRSIFWAVSCVSGVFTVLWFFFSLDSKVPKWVHPVISSESLGGQGPQRTCSCPWQCQKSINNIRNAGSDKDQRLRIKGSKLFYVFTHWLLWLHKKTHCINTHLHTRVKTPLQRYRLMLCLRKQTRTELATAHGDTSEQTVMYFPWATLAECEHDIDVHVEMFHSDILTAIKKNIYMYVICLYII